MSERSQELLGSQLVLLVAKLAALGVELGELDHYFERRAILEFDGGLPRHEAEARAAVEAIEMGKRRRA